MNVISNLKQQDLILKITPSFYSPPTGLEHPQREIGATNSKDEDLYFNSISIIGNYLQSQC